MKLLASSIAYLLLLSVVESAALLSDLDPAYKDKIEQLRPTTSLFSIEGVSDRVNQLTTYLGITERTPSESTLFITKKQADGIVQIVFDASVQSGSDVASAFVDAAAFWDNIVGNTNLQTASANDPASICGLNGNDFSGVPTTFDSIVIFARVAPIDGRGRVLGNAGPCATLSGFARLGVMNFDSADAQSLIDDGSFDEVIKHEMGHVLGIGTLWSNRNLVLNPCNGANPCNTNPTFRGSNAIEGFNELGGTGELAVADQGGGGTADGHWRERTFENELMTGFLSSGRNPMSIMSIKSLIDLGFNVNLASAEAYQIPGVELATNSPTPNPTDPPVDDPVDPPEEPPVEEEVVTDSPTASPTYQIDLGDDEWEPEGGVDENEDELTAVSGQAVALGFIGIGVAATLLTVLAVTVIRQRAVNRKRVEQSKRWMNGQMAQPYQRY